MLYERLRNLYAASEASYQRKKEARVYILSLPEACPNECLNIRVDSTFVADGHVGKLHDKQGIVFVVP